MEKKKRVIIIGAGLVGSLWALYMAKAGYCVTIYERRKDMRRADLSAGKSINLALSQRGWKALDGIGIGDEIRKIAIPMYGRVMHDVKGNLTYQPYGKDGQAIYSVSRANINMRMMDLAENAIGEPIHFSTECRHADLEHGTVHLTNTVTGKTFCDEAELVFAADGAFSSVRYASMQKRDRFNYSQQYIADGYREILLPGNADGTHKLEKNALHIWPRGRFMLIALPNEDGSFTCTLFMPHAQDEYSFDQLKNSTQVNNFFKKLFPDFFHLMPNVADAWEEHPLSSLAIVRCHPWTIGKVALLGDAAHATVPFFGQGMNAGFEDCTVMWGLMQKHGEDWQHIFRDYDLTRKPDGDALQDLSVENYYEMRDFVADPLFLLRKKIEARFSERYPEKWMTLYAQVAFSDIPYSEAYKKGREQSKIMDQVMAIPAIESKWDSDEVMHKMFDLCR